MEIQKELENDDISPIQGRVDKLFDEAEIEEVTSTEFPEDRMAEVLEEYTENDCIPRKNYPDLITSILEQI